MSPGRETAEWEPGPEVAWARTQARGSGALLRSHLVESRGENLGSSAWP